MSQATSLKRRRHPRVVTRIPVRISTIEPERDPGSGRSFFRASQETSGNLSRSGAFVKTAEPLTPGRRLLVEIALPDGSPVEAIGRVAWTKRIVEPNSGTARCGAGVEFIAGPPDQLESLDAYLQKLIDTRQALEPTPS